MDNAVYSPDPQVSVLLAGKTCTGKIFGCGAGADGNRHGRDLTAFGQKTVKFSYVIFKLDANRFILYYEPNRLAGRLRACGVFGANRL